MRETEFYIIRHSETLLNNLGRAQGWIDSPLTDNGTQTAYLLKETLSGISFSAAYSSDFKCAIGVANCETFEFELSKPIFSLCG